MDKRLAELLTMRKNRRQFEAEAADMGFDVACYEQVLLKAFPPKLTMEEMDELIKLLIEVNDDLVRTVLSLQGE